MFENKETRAYQLLETSLKQQKLSQCYLFSGQSTNIKKEMAYHFAASIMLGSKSLICHDNSFLTRIKENKHLDFHYLSGELESIKTEDLDNLLNHLQKTAIEKGLGRKVYIIDYIENASLKVYNQLLKFIEETPGNNTFGILLCQDSSSLLPTIVSRCVKVPFVYDESQDYLEKYLLAKIVKDKAYFLSKIFPIYDIAYNDDFTFNLAYDFLLKTNAYLNNEIDSLAFYFHQELSSLAINENSNLDLKVLLKTYFLLIFYFAKAFYQNISEVKDLYDNIKPDILKSLYILSGDYLNILKTNTDVKLLFDRFAYDISQLRG